MLSDILYPNEKDRIPGLSGANDSSGHKRIDKLNDIFRKSQPLKPWPLRENKDSKVNFAAQKSIMCINLEIRTPNNPIHQKLFYCPLTMKSYVYCLIL